MIELYTCFLFKELNEHDNDHEGGYTYNSAHKNDCK